MTPAAPGPASCEVERLISSFELPSTSWSRSTSEGRYDWYRDVEEDRGDADEEPDRVHVCERQGVERVGDRKRDEQHSPGEIADDEDRLPLHPVDPDAGRDREQDERQELDHDERGDRERARIEQEHRHERQRQPRELGAEDADRLRGPEVAKVSVPPEPARQEPPHQRGPSL